MPTNVDEAEVLLKAEDTADQRAASETMVHFVDLGSKNEILEKHRCRPAHHLVEAIATTGTQVTDSFDAPNMEEVWSKIEPAITNDLREEQVHIEDGLDVTTKTWQDTSSEEKTARERVKLEVLLEIADDLKLMVLDGVRAFGISIWPSSSCSYYLDVWVLWPLKKNIQDKLQKNQPMKWRINYRKWDEKEGKASHLNPYWFNFPVGVVQESNPADGLGPGYALHNKTASGYSTCGMLVQSEDELFILTTGHGFAVGDLAYQKVENIWLNIGETVLSEKKVDPINGSFIDAALIKVYPGTQIPSAIAAPGLPAGRHIINVWGGNILHLDKVCVVKSGARGFTKGKITDVCYHEYDQNQGFWHLNGILSDIPAAQGDSGSILMSESGTAIAMLYGHTLDRSSRRFGLLRDILPSLSRRYAKPLEPVLNLDLATAYPNPAFRQQMRERLQRQGTLGQSTKASVRIIDSNILPGVNPRPQH